MYTESMTTTRKRSRKITDRPNVALVYVRVSTARQAEEGISLDAQERTVTAAAEAAGYSVEVLREEGRSAGSISGRPVLREALSRLAAGEAAALYVAKIDRLARSTADVLKIADAAEREGWRMVAQDLALDTGTPVGRLVLTVLAAVAEMERAQISARHRDWHAEKAAQGIVWGVDEGPRALLPDEVRQRIAAEHQEGRSLRAIAAGLNAEEIPTARGGRWHASTVRAILGSPSLTVAA
jgi:DNA invertase Pin-like site-specific DNA recombinase